MRRLTFGIILIVLILGILVSYEWYGAFKKSHLIEMGIYSKEPFPITSGTPWYLIPFYTLLSYLQKAWFCLGMAFLIAGAVQTFIPKELIIKHLGKRSAKAYLMAAFGGPLLSVCSCSIIPLFAAIKKRGAGLGPAITFLLATPAINPAAIILTFSLLNWKFVAGRIILALSAAIITGLILEKIWGQEDNAQLSSLNVEYQHIPLNLKKDLIDWLKNVWDFIKKILPLVLLGIFIIGIIKIFLTTEVIGKYLGPGLWQTALASILGVVMYTPTLVEIPFIRELLGLGMGTGPALAFLLTGPALSLPSMLGISKVIGWKKVLNYALMMWILGIIGGLIFNYFVPVIHLL
ncbi:MAG: permease [Parcubacteria group bacterium]|nr:permease [Parcubacteria group bacterium]